MTSGKRAVFGWALAIALAGGSALAAGSSATDVATARELYRQGADAIDRGDNKAAAEKLAQAWALVQTPVIGTDLARAQVALGHLVEAREAALAVARLPVARDETAYSTLARTRAERIAAEIGPKIPHLQLTIKGVVDDDEATVTLDAAVVPWAALVVARQANPGAHRATLDTKDGRHAEASTTLREGDTKEIVLAVGPAPHRDPVVHPPPVDLHASAPAPPIATGSTESTPASKGTAPWVWVGAATGGVGLAVGSMTGAFALNEVSIVKTHCTAVGADGQHVCGPNDIGHLSAASTLATVSTLGFVAAGVGVGVMIVGLVLSGGKGTPKPARVLPMVGPVAGVAGAF